MGCDIAVLGELVNARDEHLAKREKGEMNHVDRMRLAMTVMQYNQSFVNVTDGKANTLLLINSIFLATGAASAFTSALDVVASAAASVAVLLCLTVVFARLPQQMKRDRAKLLFFGHICQRRQRAAYVEDFRQAGAREIAESLAKQIYDLAGVVDRKFRAYRRAQLVTIFSAAVWIANLLRPALELLEP